MAGAAASLAGSLPRGGSAGKAAGGGRASLPAVNYGGGTLSRAAVSAAAGTGEKEDSFWKQIKALMETPASGMRPEDRYIIDKSGPDPYVWSPASVRLPQPKSPQEILNELDAVSKPVQRPQLSQIEQLQSSLREVEALGRAGSYSLRDTSGWQAEEEDRKRRQAAEETRWVQWVLEQPFWVQDKAARLLGAESATTGKFRRLKERLEEYGREQAGAPPWEELPHSPQELSLHRAEQNLRSSAGALRESSPYAYGFGEILGEALMYALAADLPGIAEASRGIGQGISTLSGGRIPAGTASRLAAGRLSDFPLDLLNAADEQESLGGALKQAGKEQLYGLAFDSALELTGAFSRVDSLSDEDFDFVMDEIIVGDSTLPEALHTLDEKKMTQATFGDKVEGDGSKQPTLTRTQKVRLETLNNTIHDHLTETDFSGALRDLQGDPVPNGRGGYFDHLGEMKDSYKSLKKIKKAIEGSLKNPNLSETNRGLLQEGLAACNLYLNRIEELFRLYGGID